MSLVMNVSNEVLTLPTGAPFAPYTTAVVDTTVQPMLDWVLQGRVDLVSASPGPPLAASVVLGELAWCGNYDVTLVYSPGQTVNQGGSFYTALVTSHGINPAGDGGTHWLPWPEGSGGGTTYTPGTGITISGTAISVTPGTYDAAGAAAAAQVAALTASDSAGTAAAAVATELARAEAAEALLAPKASPTLTGTVTVPTASTSDSTTKAASTALVDNKIAASGSLGLFNVKAAPYNATGNGTTNDTTAVQAAITAASAAGGGVVFFPAGTYLLDPVTCASNCQYNGAGVGSTILKQNSGDTLHVGVTGSGSGSNISFSNMTLQGSLSQTGSGISLVNSIQDVRITDCAFDSYYYSAIYIRGARRVWIERNKCTNIGTINLTNVIDFEAIVPPDTATDMDTCYILNNYLETSPVIGINTLVYNNSGTRSRSVIAGNVVKSCFIGIGIESNGSQVDNIVVNNHIMSCSNTGLMANNTGNLPGGGTVTDTNALKNTILAHNNIDCVSASASSGIVVTHSHCVVQGNTIRSSLYGIYAGPEVGTRRAYSLSILDNVINVTNGYSAIYASIADSSLIAGNTCAQETGSTTGGNIQIDGCTNIVIQRNLLVGPCGKAILSNNGANTKVLNNTILDGNADSKSSGNGCAIYFSNACPNSHVLGNVIHDTRSTPKLIYGIAQLGTGTIYTASNVVLNLTGGGSSTFGTTAATLV